MHVRSSSVAQLLAVASLSLSSVTAQSTGTFDILTYNIAGLPAWLSDNGVPGDKGTNAGTIGSIMAENNYDIIHVQEDFGYHSQLYETDDHTYRTETLGNVPFGDGLNTLSNYAFGDFSRHKWDKCFINQADCLTPKGFSFMRASIDAIEVDLYNLHADAGNDQGDINARSAGIDQLLAYIEENSAGRAIIIAGDTNDLWTKPALSINKLTDAGFLDPWVDLVRGGVYPTPGSDEGTCDTPAANNNCEVLDKVLYRSGDSVTLTATSIAYKSDIFVQPDGNILSDHNPVHVEFSWTA
jgi:endonuclease/exonuclease/phosphatase family metal-dependent hydrolase